MTNRTLIYLTGLVFLGMIILFALNMTSILTGTPENQTYLKYNNVRGIAVSYHHLLYTLNFKQQNKVIDILNRAVHVIGLKPGKRQKPTIDNIVIYQFDDQPNLDIIPVAYIDNNLVFSVPQWDSKNYFMEISNGDLQRLLSQTYDP